MHTSTSLQIAWHQVEEILLVQEAEGTNGAGDQAANGQPETDFDESQERWVPRGVRR